MRIRERDRRSPVGMVLPGIRGREGGSDACQSATFATPLATEIHLVARPSAPGGSFDRQARSAYRNLFLELRARGMAPEQIVMEKVFLADATAPAEAIRTEAYRKELRRGRTLPPVTVLRQPPARPGHLVEIQAYGLAPGRPAPWKVRSLRGMPAGVSGRLVEGEGLRRLFLANVTGGEPGDGLGFSGQAERMFDRVDSILKREGFRFDHVARTWIHLADIGRDYSSLNRARNRFFRSRGIIRFPASTGIQGAPSPVDRRCSLDLIALQAARPLPVRSIHSPAMNEADEYGSAFSRGARLDLSDRTVILLSGTASIDRKGNVTHVGDIEGQLHGMLLNVESLLAGQGACPEHLISLNTYLKRPEFLPVLERQIRRHRFPPCVPHAVTVADVCRPDWLCEMEAIAVRLEGSIR